MKVRIILMAAAILIFSASLALAGKGYRTGGDQGFSSMDTNNDGLVSQEEYLAPFMEWDADGDGALSRDEWISSHGRAMGKGQKSGKMKYPRMDRVDTDNDGQVSAEEFEAVYPGMSESYPMLDLNKDGVVDGEEWEDFRRMHTRTGRDSGKSN